MAGDTDLAPVGASSAALGPDAADEGAHGCEVGVRGHAPRVAKRRFVSRRSLAVLRWRHDLPAPHAHARRHVRRDVPRPARRDGRQRGPAAPRADLGASVGSLQWIVDGYAVALASLMLPCGDLGDRHGHKRVVLAGWPPSARGRWPPGSPPGRRCSSRGASCRAPAPRSCSPAPWRSSRALPGRGGAGAGHRHLGCDLVAGAAGRGHRRRRARRRPGLALGLSRQPAGRRGRAAGHRARRARVPRAGARAPDLPGRRARGGAAGQR